MLSLHLRIPLAQVYDDLGATLPKHLKKHKWHSIGRLDADTVGLLLVCPHTDVYHVSPEIGGGAGTISVGL